MMMHKQICVVLGLAIGTLQPLQLVQANPPRSIAILARLTPEQVKNLKAIAIPILVPVDFAADFKVAKVTVDRNRRFGPGYEITYKNPQKACFSIRSTKGGIGGPSYDFTHPVRNELLGATVMLFGQLAATAKAAGDRDLDRLYSTLYTEWQPLLAKPQANLYSFTTGPDARLGCQKGITPRRVIGIFQSLRLME